MVNITRISLLLLSCLLAMHAGIAQTANNSVPSYTSPFQYGINGAYAGNNWNDQTLAKIASNAGSNSIRVGLYDYFLEQYGNNVRTSTFNYYTNTLKFSDNIVFLNGAADNHVDKTVYPGCSQHSLVFANIYQPIWLVAANGTKTINPTNYFAQYVYNVVQNYGSNIKFYEIWNEPDFTYGSNGYAAKGSPGNWFDNAPNASDLTNIQAPVFYYIRMMHIAYEVVKSISPNSMVATGGLGYSSFADVLLRYTDNPVDGSVTTAYPLKGGAYFDVLSFHSYPFYELGQWSNAAGKMVYTRSSDGNADRFLIDKQAFNTVLAAHQYDGSVYPAKYFICTETNVPSTANPASPGQYGTAELQKNYLIKTMVNAQVNGVKQLYLYALDNGTGAAPLNMNDFMGMYNYLPSISPGAETLTKEGVAFKTVSNQLRGLSYDAGLTATLKLPATVGGAGFSGLQNGKQTQKIVVWARTTLDMSETANATISLPASIGASFKNYAWNAGSDTTAYTKISGSSVALTSSPVFLVPASGTANLPVTILASAGANTSITLPVSTVILDGSASAGKNTILTTYTWKEIQGAAVTIQTPAAIKSGVTGLTRGTYVFQLTVADNNGHSGTAQVTITVNPAPVIAKVLANAGPNQTLVLPASVAMLDGSVSTATNTTISSYIWKQILGPSAATLQASTSAKTNVSGLIQGKYVFSLKISDANKVSDSTSITIIVSPAPVVASVVANAGNAQTLVFPASTANLNGSGSTAQNTTITSYAWSQIQGPVAAKISTPTAANSAVSSMSSGNYIFQLKVADNSGHNSTAQVNVQVNASTAVASVLSNAGPNQSVTLPVNTATLTGTGSGATNTTISSYRWMQLSGPPNLIWGNTTTASTNIAGLTAGSYQFELIVADNTGRRDSSKMTLTVNPVPVQVVPAVIASAGPDQTLTLPANLTTLVGTGSSASNTTITSYRWIQLSGPPNVVWENTTAVNTKIGGLTAGKYLFKLIVADNNGHRDSSQMTLTVNPVPNVPLLVANAGTNQTITLPTDTTTLVGTRSNAVNTSISSYRWMQLSGPPNVIWQNTTTVNTRIAGLTAGMYLFKLIIANSSGLRDSSLVTINVISKPVIVTVQTLTAHAGVNQNITLPTNYAILDGTGSVAGTDALYNWKQISGPGGALLNSPSSIRPTVTNLVSGTYVFELLLTNTTGGKDSAAVTVTVAGIAVADMLLYPNPVQAQATLQASYTATGQTAIEVYTAAGVKVMALSVNKPGTYLSQNLDLSRLSAGIYILRTTTGTTVKSVRFIKN